MSHHTSVSAWTPVKGFEDAYVVNPFGEVRSVDRTVTTAHGVKRKYKGKTIKPTVSGMVKLSSPDGGTAQMLTSDVVISTLGHEPLDPETPEMWLPVPGHDGRYEVSDFDRVRDVRTGELVPVVDDHVHLYGSESVEVVTPWEVRRRAHAKPIDPDSGVDIRRVWRAVPGCAGYEISGGRAVRKVDGPRSRRVSTKHNEFTVYLVGRSRVLFTYEVHLSVFPELDGGVL